MPGPICLVSETSEILDVRRGMDSSHLDRAAVE